MRVLLHRHADLPATEGVDLRAQFNQHTRGLLPDAGRRAGDNHCSTFVAQNILHSLSPSAGVEATLPMIQQ